MITESLMCTTESVIYYRIIHFNIIMVIYEECEDKSRKNFRMLRFRLSLRTMSLSLFLNTSFPLRYDWLFPPSTFYKQNWY